MHTQLDYFIQLQEYNPNQFDQFDGFESASRILFGLYFSDSGVSPVVVSNWRHEFVGAITHSDSFVHKLTRQDIKSECYFCEAEISRSDSYTLDSPEFYDVQEYPTLLERYISDEHLQEGVVWSVSPSQVAEVCESCFRSFMSVQDSLFEEHSSVVLAYEV